MTISVLMPAYNAQAHIAAALTSVLRQNIPALEVIVVDDGSSDQTCAIVQSFIAKGAPIRLIAAEHAGVSIVRNRCLDAISPQSEFVTFLDSDDLMPLGRLTADLALLAADPTLDFTYGRVTLFHDANADDTAPLAGSETATGRGVQLGAGTYRTSFMAQIGRFNESLAFAEDVDFLLRGLDLQPRYRTHERICLYYRRHGSNMTHQHNLLMRREFARVLLASTKRRKALNLPNYPADFFDLQELKKARDW